MRLAALLLSTLAACVPCKLSSECGEGAVCADGTCLTGCQSDDDCTGGRARCERSTGLCRLNPGPSPFPSDGGAGDVGASEPDAGAADASERDGG